MHVASYTVFISRNIGNVIFGSLLRKHCWWDFKLADFSSVWKETHACGINRSIMA